MNRNQDLIKCFSSIDLTSLNNIDTPTKIEQICEKVNAFHSTYSQEYGSVAAICVYPNFVETVAKSLTNTKVNICCVAGGFPDSQTFNAIKLAEVEVAQSKGAKEIDIVIPIGEMLEGNVDEVFKQVKSIKSIMDKAHLKVILESSLLKTNEIIQKASFIVMEAGADFIKTSTGKAGNVATPEAVRSMCLAIKEYYIKTGRKVGIKAAGGIVEPNEALVYLDIVRNILGQEWINPELFRIGASRLANNILTVLEQKEIKYF